MHALEDGAEAALADQGFELRPEALRIRCQPAECLDPGTRIDVSLDWVVDLPWVPDAIRGAASLPIHVQHVVPVDDYRVTR